MFGNYWWKAIDDGRVREQVWDTDIIVIIFKKCFRDIFAWFTSERGIGGISGFFGDAAPETVSGIVRELV